MKDLIERLERATGPDRGLDGEIYCLDPVVAPLWPHWTLFQREELTPFYTASLDAAMTLAKPKSPSHWPWVTLATVNPNDPRGCVAQIWLSNDRKFTGKGATLELALTACALKAQSRSVEEPKE